MAMRDGEMIKKSRSYLKEACVDNISTKALESLLLKRC
jgi:hypothetical protein